MPETSASGQFTDHWAGCEACQAGLDCSTGDPLWYAMHEEVLDQQGSDPDA